ncbi:MAG: YigZ family protein [Chitinophagaceae bacterium]|nr:YigZ family protein [Chitinophagaceae bacterium]
MEQATYLSLSHRAVSEFKDRGSRFIGIALPIAEQADIKIALEQIKTEFPRATHYCYAWRLGFNKTQYRANDDGEPSGSAGKPILGQIDSLNLTRVLVVVVRYFGGSKLGVPGLISAYKTAATQALQEAGIQSFDRCHIAELEFDYTLMNEVMRCLKPYNIEIKQQVIGLFCSMNIGIPFRNYNAVLTKLKNIHNLHFTLLQDDNA